jgi:arylsulfatase
VAAALGFGKGFDRFREIWTDKRLKDEAAGARAITDTAVRLLRDAPRERPFFLWLHYVNPHAPYTPPPPFDAAFRDDAARGGGEVRTVVGFNGGVSRKLAVPGQNRLGYYVSQYDGEIAFTDGEVGRVLAALAASGHEENTLVVLTSDHGESLGEHNYYFDHGADLFDPCLHVPLIIYDPRVKHAGRSAVLASTLDVVPTILDALKVSFPPELAGVSLLAAVEGRALPERQRLFAENDRGLVGTHDGRFKLVRDPAGPESTREALFDRSSDRAEERDLIARQSQEARRQRAALDAYLAERSQEWALTRLRLGGGGPSGDAKLGHDDCLRLLALGYVDSCP